MRPSPATEELARDLAARRQQGNGGSALFLGAACSRAAHAPRVADVAREVFDQLREDDEIETPDLPPPDAGDEEIVRAFRRLVLQLPPIQRRALSLHAATGLPVPAFMQDMAVLVRDGLFSTVLTSAFDALTERALALVGLRSGQSLHLDDVGGEGSITPATRGVQLTMVHGMRVPGTIELPIVVVGHESDDAEILDALTTGGDPVWWVNTAAPPAGLERVRAAREVHVIDGPDADPDWFFGVLALLAVQMPAVNALSVTPDTPLPTRSGDGPRSISAALTAAGGTAPPMEDGEFERQFLEGRLRRSEEILGRGQLQAVIAAADSTLERQLAYQRHVIAVAEEKLRALGSQRNDLLDLLAEIEGSPEADADRGAAAYLHETVARIREEYDGPDPDEDVVSAALAAIGVLGARLGVTPGLLHRLDAFVPSAQGIVP